MVLVEGVGTGGAQIDSVSVRGYYCEPGHAHPLSPASQENNKPIVAAALMGRQGRYSTTDRVILLAVSTVIVDCYSCRCYNPVSSLLGLQVFII